MKFSIEGARISKENEMGRVFQRYLDGAEIYSCANCKTHLASANCIVSKVGSVLWRYERSN